MARRFSSHVHVVDDDGASHTFGPDDKIPAWVNAKVTNESVWADADSDSAASLEAPAGNASTEAWQEYAKSRGATDADLDGKSRDELRDQYGS